jgi:SIR2-like protein
MTDEPLVTRLDRLATRIVAGDVVFFVGAGFSLDSEHNDAQILIVRLISRFQAIVDAVQARAVNDPLAKVVTSLSDALPITFSLTRTEEDGIWGKALLENVKLLAQNYYLINDWMCSAFEALLANHQALTPLATAIQSREVARFESFVNAREDAAKEKAARDKKPWSPSPYRPTNPQPLDFVRLGQLFTLEANDAKATTRASAGKAMFLEAMGFGDQAVMAGDPHADRLENVYASYIDRLKPRHAVLAWLALEGLLPVLVTTNYDLLIEGAYRLAGLQPLLAERYGGTRTAATPQTSWNRRLRHYTPIADAMQFFSHGDGHQSALILKIHGCAHLYRTERGDLTANLSDGQISEQLERWRQVLPTIVFTFREIQNWRDDSWSRDYLQSLLRTRTVLFAGYSTTDAVIHDTFRSVYEEMARYRAQRMRPIEAKAQAPPADTPPSPAVGSSATAFVMNITGRREFHALEILRAASLAAGDRSPDVTSHTNLLNFSLTPSAGFPTVDEMCGWLFHLTYRQLQQQAVASELRRVAYQLFGTPAPESEAQLIETHFNQLLEAERNKAKKDEDAVLAAPADRRATLLHAQRRGSVHTVGWTLDFHRALMRDYAAADLLVRKPERAGQMHTVLRWPFYAPINEHPEWAAWAVVVELAIRRRAARWSGRAEQWLEPGEWAMPAAGDRAIVCIPKCPKTAPSDRTPRNPAPTIALTIEVGELRQLINTRSSNSPLNFLPRVVWTLRRHAVPWWQDPRPAPSAEAAPARPESRTADEAQSSLAVRDALTPAARAMWRWAIGHETADDRKDPIAEKAQDFFGGVSSSGTRHDAA